jgi:3-isopropylmalate/(R)-2-methylmalate dehydratase large subunit
MVSNAGCAGCAAGQVGQNGPGEVTISSGNRNFPGKQGKGDVYLASPAIIAASAIAGYITTPDQIPDENAVRESYEKMIRKSEVPASKDKKEVKIAADDNLENEISAGTKKKTAREKEKGTGKSKKLVNAKEKPVLISGNVWFINKDNIDTDMIYHNRYLSITDIGEMGKYAFGNLAGYEDFAEKAKPGDIIVTGKNFGSGSSRQQAVDCFRVLGIQCIIAESFGAIYERNAINAAFPVLVAGQTSRLELRNGDKLRVDFSTGEVVNLRNKMKIQASPFSEVQMDIYQKGDLF